MFAYVCLVKILFSRSSIWSIHTVYTDCVCTDVYIVIFTVWFFCYRNRLCVLFSSILLLFGVNVDAPSSKAFVLNAAAAVVYCQQQNKQTTEEKTNQNDALSLPLLSSSFLLEKRSKASSPPNTKHISRCDQYTCVLPTKIFIWFDLRYMIHMRARWGAPCVYDIYGVGFVKYFWLICILFHFCFFLFFAKKKKCASWLLGVRMKNND